MPRRSGVRSETYGLYIIYTSFLVSARGFLCLLCIFMQKINFMQRIFINSSARETPPHPTLSLPHRRWGTWLWLGFGSAKWRRLFATQSTYHINIPNLSIFSTHPIYLIAGRVGMMGTLPIMGIIGILGKSPRMALFQHFQGFLGLFCIGNDKGLVYSIRLTILFEAHLGFE